MATWRSKTGALFLSFGIALAADLCRAGEKPAGHEQQPPAPEPGTFDAVIANNPISAILQGPKLWTTRQEPEDWVKATRPKEPSDYMPVGVTPPQHSLRVKTQAELAATKADLEATRAAMEKRLPRKPVLNSAGAQPGAADPGIKPTRPAKRKLPDTGGEERN